MKIAIPTNDENNIFSKMLGQAKEFHIYEFENNKIKFLEKRKNPFEKTLQPLKTLDVYEIISDCDIIFSHKIGKKGIERLTEREMRVIFKKGKITDSLQNFVGGKNV